MKNILLILAIAISSASFAQGNLQFNQVKLVTTVETVPAGKVWKVESATFQGGAPICVGAGPNSGCGSQNIIYTSYQASMSYLINGASGYIAHGTYGGTAANASSNVIDPFPIWLPAGTTLAAGTNMMHLSVIEFNVVP